MISKKMRNISMVCLSLVLALSLAFGLSSFSSIKKADAATNNEIADGVLTTTFDFSDWQSDWTVSSSSNVATRGDSSSVTGSYKPNSVPTNDYFNVYASAKSGNLVLISKKAYKDITAISFNVYSNDSNNKYQLELVDKATDGTSTSISAVKATANNKWVSAASADLSSSNGEKYLKFTFTTSASSGNKYIAISSLIVKSVAPEIKEVVSLDEPTTVKKYAGSTVSLPSALSGLVGENENVDDIAVTWASNNTNITISNNIATIKAETPAGVYEITATAVGNALYAATNAPTTTLKIQVLEEGEIIIPAISAGTTELNRTVSTDDSYVFYIDKTADVSFIAKSATTSESKIDFGKSTSTDGTKGTISNKLIDGVKVTGQTFTQEGLSAGVYEVQKISGANALITSITVNYLPTVENGVCTTYNACDLPATCVAPEGYTFVGWLDSNNAFQTEATSAATFNAVFAKAKYLGISFRKSAEDPAVRFGYVVNIVDANENALNGLTLNASAVFNVANLANGSSANVSFEKLNIAFNEKENGYLANLSITGIDSAKAQNALNVDMTITINGVSITAESDAIESDTIVSKAQKLYDAGQLTDAQAEIYGVVLNG